MAKPTAKKPASSSAKKLAPKKLAAKKLPAKKLAAQKVLADPPEVVPVVEGSEDAFNHFLPQAKALTATEIVPFHADVSLASRNVNEGVAAVTAARGSIEARVSDIDWPAIAALPSLGLAVCFAARRVEGGDPATGSQALLAEGRALRRILVTTADALAENGLLPTKEVDKAHRGRGARHTASDLEDLAALFQKHAAAIKGRHSVTATQLTRAKVIGATLLTVLKPKGAPRSPKSADAAAAIDARDRLWTLLEVGYEEVRRLGMWEWVDDVDAHVPALQAHRGHGRPHKKAGSGGGKPSGPSGATSGATGGATGGAGGKS